MNIINLCGRLVREPEVKLTPSDKTIANFTLAVDRNFKNSDGQKECDFINIVAFGKLAETCGNWLVKGQQCIIIGRLQLRNYEANDGTRKYVTEVIANSMEFVGTKGRSGENTKSKAEEDNDAALAQISDSYGGGYPETIPF